MTPSVRTVRGPLVIAAVVVLVDQLTKHWAQSALRGIGRQGIQVVPGCFHLAYAENTNAAFGIMQSLPYDARRMVDLLIEGLRLR